MIDNFYILSFLWGMVMSFAFTMPPGIINLSVLDTTVHRGLKYGIYLSLAACIVEFCQAFIATKFSSWFYDNPTINVILKSTMIPIFLILGISYLFKAIKARKALLKNESIETPKKQIGSFRKGILVGILNPMAIPFFIFLAEYTHENKLLKAEISSILIYVLGTTVGTFLAFLLYALLSKVISSKLTAIRFYVDLIIGVVFIILSLHQLGKALSLFN